MIANKIIYMMKNNIANPTNKETDNSPEQANVVKIPEGVVLGFRNFAWAPN